MPLTLTSSYEVQVSGGPRFSSTMNQALEAYDVMEVVVADGASDTTIEVQPGGAGQVQFLHVSASLYAAGLTYKVDAAANPPHDLDRPLLLAGSGAVGLLGGAPSQLLFSNSTDQDVTIQVLVGRDATP